MQEQFLSEAAQQGIVIFMMAAAIVGLCWYLKVLDNRAEARSKAEDERQEAQATREDERAKADAARYQAIIDQVMEQQKNMMNLLFGVINRNSNVQQNLVETINNAATSTTPPKSDG